MKNKLIFMIFTVSLLLNVSCTDDGYDNGEIRATDPKNSKIIPNNVIGANNIIAIDSLGVNTNLQVEEPDGDPSNIDPR